MGDLNCWTPKKPVVALFLGRWMLLKKDNSAPEVEFPTHATQPVKLWSPIRSPGSQRDMGGSKASRGQCRVRSFISSFHLQVHPAKEPGCTGKSEPFTRCSWTTGNKMWGAIRSRAWERVSLRVAVLRRTPRKRTWLQSLLSMYSDMRAARAVIGIYRE